MALPIILCSFGYHQVIPLVCRQLNYKKKNVILALSIGVFIPFLFNATILTAGFRMFTAEELSRAANLGVPIFPF
jgi:amino acid permease